MKSDKTKSELIRENIRLKFENKNLRLELRKQNRGGLTDRIKERFFYIKKAFTG
jgi:regulator of replication initiation timing